MKLYTKFCAYCGKEFQAKVQHALYCSGPHYMTCPVCNKEYQVTNHDKLKFPPTACSYSCRTVITTRRSLEKYGCSAPGNNPEARKKASKTMMKHHGVPHAMMSEEIRKKSIHTLIERYGVDNVGKNLEITQRRIETDKKNHGGILAFNTPESYARRKQTVLERFGCEVWSSPEIREKIKETMFQRYGVEYLMQVPEFKLKQQKTMMDKYGVVCAFASPEIRRQIEQTMIERYGVPNPAYSEELRRKADETMMQRYGKCSRVSKINEQFESLLQDRKIEYQMEYFIEGKWYDFYIPTINTLIEINPTYTHNVFGNHWGQGISIDYHSEKTNLASKYGHRCIHVFDWDVWDDVINLVSNRIRIYARKCKIFKLYTDIAQKFIQSNDLTHKCNTEALYFGLIYDNEIIQVIALGKPICKTKHTAEILKLCTKKGYQVIGGASRLFKFTIQYIEPESVVAYCDLSKFTGQVYEKLGMKLIKQTLPQEIWSKNTERIPAKQLKYRGYNQLFKTSHDKSISDEQLMIEKGWLPVYDCGQAVYEWRG